MPCTPSWKPRRDTDEGLWSCPGRRGYRMSSCLGSKWRSERLRAAHWDGGWGMGDGGWGLGKSFSHCPVGLTFCLGSCFSPLPWLQESVTAKTA
jgi:hypothetical protein